ncbi:hypothetical protein [Arthrobacter sp. M4]|uniref:hypothetical protein n=1 Tax=Arthrobacter sp. M4 TaxID=218160 RepID=UPI001CDCD63B|nr:hypothetical protein [Arthrobacter sp. M4]MCA4132236.1 hypothetical protein [Arthrobacter sp. M4]
MLLGSKQDSHEGGSAVVEFVFLSLLLMVPVVYFVLSVGAIQSGAYAVAGAADQAAKVYVTYGEEAAASEAAGNAAMIALADHGHSAELASVAVSCDRQSCMSPGAAVTVTVRLRVPLPFTPFPEELRIDASRVTASATQIVGRFR